MRDQRGVTALELVVVVTILSVTVTFTAIHSMPWMARESMRSAANEIVSFMQLAKIEAASRNRQCRFVIDTSNGALEIWDSMGTDDVADDSRLHVGSLPSSVNFQRPDAGDTVTLDEIDGTTRYQAVFRSDGIVALGAGVVFLHGGEKFGNVQAHAAGGTEIQYWNGSAWHAGY